jgi:hypothetical protein
MMRGAPSLSTLEKRNRPAGADVSMAAAPAGSNPSGVGSIFQDVQSHPATHQRCPINVRRARSSTKLLTRRFGARLVNGDENPREYRGWRVSPPRFLE